MTLEEEKKLVAEKLNISFMITPIIRAPIEEWNPQSERKWWDEIFLAICKEELISEFIGALDLIIPEITCEFEELTASVSIGWDMLTAKPEQLWKALIKTLTEMGADNDTTN